MAKCFTMDIGTARATEVQKYFAKFKVLPPKNVRVDSTTDIIGHASFENLGKRIVLDKADEFVIVVHGHENGSGLFLPLANGNESVRTLHTNLKILNEIADSKGGKISESDKNKLALSETQIKRLLKLRSDLHAKKIKTVEFRGCNLGRNKSSVQQFRSFFGADTFGAPNLHSFFGQFPTKSGSSVMSSHAKSHQGTTFTYTSDFAGKKCHCCVGVNTSRKPVNGHIVADDDATLDRWIQANLSATASKGSDKKIPTHGLWIIPTIDLTNPDIFAQPDPPRPIFPLATDANGLNEYRLHMVYSP